MTKPTKAPSKETSHIDQKGISKKLALAMEGKLDPSELSDEEDEIFFEHFFKSVAACSGEPASYADNEGNSVGLDDNGVFWGYDSDGKFGPLPLDEE